jgi:hypothetical protein
MQERTRHTVLFYAVDEVLSAMQKAVRRGQIGQAIWWAAELEQSGLGRLALARAGIMVPEDIGIGSPLLPQYLIHSRRRYDKAEQGAEAGAVLLELFRELAVAPKNRMANTASTAVYKLLEQHLEHQTEWLFKSVPTILRTARAFAATARECTEASEAQLAEQECLCCLQRVFLDKLDDGACRHDLAMWKEVLRWRPDSKIIADSMQCLYVMAHGGGCSAMRYALFMAVQLFTREKRLPAPPPVPTPFKSEEVQTKFAAAVPVLLNRSLDDRIVLPLYAVDKHTMRGKAWGGEDEQWLWGCSTVDLLMTDAEERGVLQQVQGWSDEELAKSHGEGRRWYRHHKLGLPTLVSAFWDEGTKSANMLLPVYRGRMLRQDPYWSIARASGLHYERLLGPRHCKSSHIVKAQWDRLQFKTEQRRRDRFVELELCSTAFPTLGVMAQPPSAPGAETEQPTTAGRKKQQGGKAGRTKSSRRRVQGAW